MSLRFIVNNAWQNAAQILITDNLDVTTADQAGAINLTGGPRHLYWESASDDNRRIVYINKSGGLSFDTFIWQRADKIVAAGANYWLESFTTYTGAATTHELGSPWAPTLVGARNQDYITTAFTVSGKQALGIRLNYAGNTISQVHGLHFGNSFTFSYPTQVIIRPDRSNVIVRGHNYLLEQRAAIRCRGISRAELTLFERLWRGSEEPLFVYDNSATLLYDSLWHCIVADYQAAPTFNDLHDVSFTLLRLRSYP